MGSLHQCCSHPFQSRLVENCRQAVPEADLLIECQPLAGSGRFRVLGGFWYKALATACWRVTRRGPTPSMPAPECTGHLMRRTLASLKISIFNFGPAGTPPFRGATTSVSTERA